jgi:hypothetical protein
MKPEYMKVADGMQARYLLGRMNECQKSGALYLNSEMEAAKLKLELRPDFKEVLREVAGTCKETMAEFVRVAAQERMERILNQRIEAGNAVESARAE